MWLQGQTPTVTLLRNPLQPGIRLHGRSTYCMQHDSAVICACAYCCRGTSYAESMMVIHRRSALNFWGSARQSYHHFLHKGAPRLFCVSFFDHGILLVSVLCQQSVVTPANLLHTAKPNIVDSITMYWRRPLRKTGEPKLPEAAGFSRLLNGGCITSLS